MQIPIPNDSYVGTNTIEDKFLLQVLGNTSIGIIVASSTPAADALPDIILNPGEAITECHTTGLLWCKSLSARVGGIVGLTE